MLLGTGEKGVVIRLYKDIPVNLYFIIVFEICSDVEKYHMNRSKSYLNAVNI